MYSNWRDKLVLRFCQFSGVAPVKYCCKPWLTLPTTTPASTPPSALVSDSVPAPALATSTISSPVLTFARFSRTAFVGSLLLLLALIGIGSHALLSDYRKGTINSSSSIRMKTRTATVITFLQILVSMGVVTSGIIGGAFTVEKILEIEKIFARVDDAMQTRGNFCSSDIRSKLIYSVGYILTHHIVLILIDVHFWLNLNSSYSWSYAVCYLYSFIQIAIQTQFAFIASNISYRFSTINHRLSHFLTVRHPFCSHRYHWRVPYENRATGNFLRQHDPKHAVGSAHRGDYFSFESFQYLHGSLCYTVEILNSAFGWQLLISILCVCVHIVVTPYYLLLDLFYPTVYGPANISFLILQVLWIITYSMQLFLLVVPASIVSRNLFGSVVTYLVILIQFQNSDYV